MAKSKAGNPKLAEVNINTRIKKGEVRNPTGRPKSVNEADLLQFDIESLLGKAMSKSQAKQIIESIDYMTIEQMKELYLSPNMPAIVKLKVKTIIDALGKDTVIKDRILTLEYIDKSAPKGIEPAGSDAVEAVSLMIQTLREQRQKEFNK